jgi:hypothetical protein
LHSLPLQPKGSNHVGPDQKVELNFEIDIGGSTQLDNYVDNGVAREEIDQQLQDEENLGLDVDKDIHADTEVNAGAERRAELDDDVNEDGEDSSNIRPRTARGAASEPSNDGNEGDNDLGDKVNDDAEDGRKAKNDGEVDRSANRKDEGQGSIQVASDVGVVALFDAVLGGSRRSEGEHPERREDEEQRGDASRLLHLGGYEGVRNETKSWRVRGG